MNVERLEKLADFLDTVEGADYGGVNVLVNGEEYIFDLSYFVYTLPPIEPRQGATGLTICDSFVAQGVRSCGTTACAIGLALEAKLFEDEGFYKHGPVGQLCLGEELPAYKKETGSFAAQIFFDITHTEFTDMFSETGYHYREIYSPTPKMVAARIRQHITGDI